MLNRGRQLGAPPEPWLDPLCNIIKTFNDQFGNRPTTTKTSSKTGHKLHEHARHPAYSPMSASASMKRETAASSEERHGSPPI